MHKLAIAVRHAELRCALFQSQSAVIMKDDQVALALWQLLKGIGQFLKRLLIQEIIRHIIF